MTYREAKGQAAAKMCAAGIENAEHESRLLLEFVTQTDWGFYLMHQEDVLPEEQEKMLHALVARRCGRVPLQYLTGEQVFLGMSIAVNDEVLIPRQETELLARIAIDRLQSALTYTGHMRVLDLCTGTGCVAIAIKKFCPAAYVCASDLSAEALELAAWNEARNLSDAVAGITWIQSDLFSDITGMYDMIVCNPPYIPTEVLDTLMPEVRDHEPRIALDGGPDGLFFYRKIIADCAPLAPGGTLLFEIGDDQAEAVMGMMRDYGFSDIQVLIDLADLDRYVLGRFYGV